MKPMSYYIITTDDCVFLTSEGFFSLDNMTAAWKEVRVELAEKRLNRVLVDVTALQNGPDMAELFDLAKLFWRNFPKSGRMALVVRWDQSTLAKLLETLLRSVGVYLTVFVSEEMAEAWIGGNSQNASTVSSGLIAENYQTQTP
jgi:hypothetical protein